jgi:polyisoprenoid-binding protein YceI
MAMSQDALAQSWQLNEKESFIVFIAKNLGMSVSGKISGMKATGDYNDENLFVSNFIGSIDVSTIDTQIAMRNNHLKSDDYFDVNKYPTITFKLKEIVKEGSALKAIGHITIKGVTKEIGITFSVKKEKDKHTIVGDVIIQRHDFHLGSSTTLIMADVIKVRIIAVFDWIK